MGVVSEAGPSMDGRLEELYRELVVGKPITRQKLVKAIRRARHTRLWWRMDPLKRGLLRAAARVVDVVKSKVLESLLEEILLEIEAASLRAKAIYYGLIIALRSLKHLGERILRDAEAILYLGISYLSNPPLYRTLEAASWRG